MPALTAGEVVDRIKANLGVGWRDATYRDTYKFGGAATEVKGIATTVFALDIVGGCGCRLQHDHSSRGHIWNDRDDGRSSRRSAVQAEGRLRRRTTSSSSACTTICTPSGRTSPTPDAHVRCLDSGFETAPQSHRFTVLKRHGALASARSLGATRSEWSGIERAGQPHRSASAINPAGSTVPTSTSW
jgi:hypothetical protein